MIPNSSISKSPDIKDTKAWQWRSTGIEMFKTHTTKHLKVCDKNTQKQGCCGGQIKQDASRTHKCYKHSARRMFCERLVCRALHAHVVFTTKNSFAGTVSCRPKCSCIISKSSKPTRGFVLFNQCKPNLGLGISKRPA